MQRLILKILAFTGWCLATVAGVAVLFIFLAFVLSNISVNSSLAQAPKAADTVEIYVTSNGVHTDIVVPVTTPIIDWRDKIPLHHFRSADSSYRYMAFGWGDRRFYMETPEWNDLKPGVALRASLWPTPTAMHVQYITSQLTPTKRPAACTAVCCSIRTTCSVH